MGTALRFGLTLTGLFILGAILILLVVKETGIILFWNYVVFGVPALIGYFLLVFLYFSTKRAVFWTCVGILLLSLCGYFIFDLLDSNPRFPA